MKGPMKRLCISIGLTLLAAPSLAQEQEDVVVTVTPTAAGAVYAYKMGVDGLLVSESYMLTRLTCTKGSSTVDFMLPVTREDSMGQDGSTLRKTGKDWHLTLKVVKSRVDKIVRFEPIADEVSLLREGTIFSMVHGDKVWKAMIDPRGDQLLALTGGFGEYESLPDDADLERFESLCGLSR